MLLKLRYRIRGVALVKLNKKRYLINLIKLKKMSKIEKKAFQKIFRCKIREGNIYFIFFLVVVWDYQYQL
jgi:hypothetical protein